MQKATKICRVCGVEYKACHTQANLDSIFRWQDVACSPECGAIYLAQINASRGIVTEQSQALQSEPETSAESSVPKRSRKKRTEQESDEM